MPHLLPGIPPFSVNVQPPKFIPLYFYPSSSNIKWRRPRTVNQTFIYRVNSWLAFLSDMTFDVDWALNIIMLKINIKNYLKNNLSKSQQWRLVYLAGFTATWTGFNLSRSSGGARLIAGWHFVVEGTARWNNKAILTCVECLWSAQSLWESVPLLSDQLLLTSGI